MAVQIILYRRPDQGSTGLPHPFGKGVEGFDLGIVHIDQGPHRILQMICIMHII